MPDDLSGWGYCRRCEHVHRRDEDGFMCDDTRPLPKMFLPASPSWLQRFLDWLRD